jgi:dTDP-4-dehydrorhamnose reductase
MIELGRTGIHHCCGDEAISRTELAQKAARALDLDPDLLDFGPPPPQRFPIPYDTSLDGSATAAALGVPAPSVDEQLRRFSREVLRSRPSA